MFKYSRVLPARLGVQIISCYKPYDASEATLRFSETKAKSKTSHMYSLNFYDRARARKYG